MKLPAALLLALSVLSLLARADSTAPATAPVAYTPQAYAVVGAKFVRDIHLDQLGWNDADIASFVEGVRAALQGKPPAATEESQRLGHEIIARLHDLDSQPAAPAFATAADVENYLKQMQRRYNLQRSHSGMCYAVEAGGIGGLRPTPQDTVIISLACTATDGSTKIPQLSLERARIRVADMLPGLAEAVQMMTLDSRGRFVIPPHLSFGDGAWPDGVARGSPLLFTMVLHEVVPAGKTP